MRKILSIFILLIPFLISIYACGPSQDYSQSYVILINQKRVGKEIVSEKTNIKGNLVCLSEQEMDTPASKNKKRRIIKTKMVLPKGKLVPVSYSYESNAGISYDVKVRDGQIIRTRQKEGETQETITPLDPDTIMLDLTVFHTIDYWIRKYDVKKGGRQILQTYLLPSASIRQLSIIPTKTFIPEHELQLKNFEIEIGDRVTMLLWVDKNNRLYRAFIKGPNIEVIRSDLFDRLNKKKE